MTVFVAGASELATLKNTFNVVINNVATPTDPTSVSLTVTDPDGIAVTYSYPATIVKVSTGVYTKDVSCPKPGQWQYVWTGTGTVSDVSDGGWEVQELSLGHLYVTPQALRSRVGIDDSDSRNDLELYGACYAASRSVEQYCERTFWRTLSSEARAFPTASGYELELGPFNDLLTVTAFASDDDGDGVYENVWPVTDYELLPRNVSSSETRPYTCVRSINRMLPYYSPLGRSARLQITGVYGWATVPAPVREAARIKASELFKAKDAPFGVASFGEYPIRIGENPLVMRLLDGYRHFNGYMV